MTKHERPVAIWTFLALTFGWTWGLWAIVVWIGDGMSGWSRALFLASAFGPGIAAFATVWAFEGRAGLRNWLRRCLKWRLGWRWYALALLTPPCLMVAALGIHVAFGWTIPNSTVQGSALIVVAKFALVIILGGPMGEEFGWRGYALPSLTARFGWRWASIVVGVVWGLWHLPLFWMPGTAQGDLPMGLFLVSTVALTVVFARLSVNTGFSVMPAILLHGSINWSSMVLPVMPNGGDSRPYTIVMILLILVATVLIVKPGPQHSERSVPS
jgi:membrane protease YdiL (CAAX protease family)